MKLTELHINALLNFHLSGLSLQNWINLQQHVDSPSTPDVTNHSLLARRGCLVSSHLSNLFLASSTYIQMSKKGNKLLQNKRDTFVNAKFREDH